MNHRNEVPRNTYISRRHNTSRNNEEQDGSKITGKAVLIVAALIAGVGIYANVQMNHNALAGSSSPKGELVESAKKVTLGSGAILRSDPYVPDPDLDISNRLGSYDFGDAKQATVDTPEGVYVVDNSNGRWVGIKRDNIKDASIDSSSVKLDTDRDGVIWVNEQRASVTDSE